MTIARRLIILLGVPLVALVGFGIFTLVRLAKIEERSNFVAKQQIPSLAALGELTRSFLELRVDVRNDLLATNQAEQAAAQLQFDKNEANVVQLLRDYADRLVSDDQDRRLLNEFRQLSKDWLAGAKPVMALAAQGRRDEATGLLASGTMAALGPQINEALNQWIGHNRDLATAAGNHAVDAIAVSHRDTIIATCTAVLLTALLGFLTFRRIVQPIHALGASVKAIAAGEYSQEVPFTSAADETGGLARSINVLKEGAAAMDMQRWVKSNVSRLTSELQVTATIAEFGKQFVSGLVPLLGGGVGGFYLFQEEFRSLERVASYGLDGATSSSSPVRVGQGLIGQCAQELKTLTLDQLPPEYLRIASGLGTAPPRQAMACPLISKGALLAIFEIATFRPFNAQEKALLEDLLPVAALSLEVLQRNLRTHEQREQLRASEERSRLILESSAEGIYGTDTDGQITFVNPATCRMLGYTAEELIGKPSHATFHHHRPDGSDYPREECPMYRAYKHGKTSRVDDEFLWRKDNTGLPVEYGATPMLKDGIVVGSVVSFTDITERKRAEVEMQRGKDELQHMNFMADGALDLTKAGYWHVPLDGSGWYISSERAARIFGDLPSPGHRYALAHWAEHVRLGDEAAAKVTAENFQAAVEGRVPVYDATYAYKRPVDGRTVWIHAMGHVVKGADGKPKDMFGVTQDITDYKQAEAEIKASEQRLRETEQFFRSVLELAPDGLMVVNAEGMIRLANAQCEKLFGYTRAELVGKPVEVLVPQEIRSSHPALRAGFHQAPTPRNMGAGRELRALRKDGSLFPVEIGLSPLPGREEEGAQVAVSIRDITERKDQENALKQAKAKAEEATQMKSMFLANMSHEIRTPMNAIIGLSHLALRTQLTPKQKDYIAKVHNAGTSLLSIINDILDFSKIEAGKLEIETTDFRLDEVISSVTTLTAQKAHEKGLEFLAHVEPGIPEYLLGDPLRLGQILTNFVNNAVKFTEQGEIRVDMRLVERTGEKVQLKFCVRDTGMGMTPEQSARLFQPFT
ncbi:MAG TPA: PAS domain S-box protein, partial [Candidatus Dormibacteraeota bacterium]|nr:PAS domain S-box protein [Candidatus Dormibacteraeota bacterium]